MRAYRQTFRQHRLLLTVPIMVAAVVGGWFTFRQPAMYASSATLWVDNGAAVPSSVTGAASVSDPSLAQVDNQTDPSVAAGIPSGPAAMESEVVTQLLMTTNFDIAVTRAAGGLVPSGVLAVATGPQVLWLRTVAASPVAARTALRALIRELGAAGSFGDSLGKTASLFYRRQLTSADSLVTGNRGSLAAYVLAHPHANLTNDATYRALVSEVQQARARQAAALAASRQADVEAQSNGGSASMLTLDPPSLAREPMAGLFTKLTGVVTGAFAGLVFSLLVLVALTPRPPLRWDAEIPTFARLAAWDQRGRGARGACCR